MSVSREIAQANSYESAFNILMFQVVILAVVVGAVSPSWWYGIMVPFVFGLCSIFAVFRFTVVVIFSVFWALLSWKIAQETGASVGAYFIGAMFFFVAYAINAAGMIGLQNATPDL